MAEGLNIPERDGRGAVIKAGHVPVLLKEAIDFLDIKRSGSYIDATVGLGGHSYEIAKRLGALGHLIGLDKDPAALEATRAKLSLETEDFPRLTLLHASFAEIGKRFSPASVDGLLADVGMSSLQLNDAARGFSFQAEGPLDMRMNPQAELTADQVVNQVDEITLANLIYEFGDERRSRRIARAIVRSRPIRTTAQLAEIVSGAARPMNQAERRIHPATKTFQALRIFVNDELKDLQELMTAAPQVLKPGGRLVVISFHSLEDRIVKDALRSWVKQGHYRILTKKPVTPGEEEMQRNPRSRSAKLRAAERV
ncbi:MAG: 16S rRNA (cytosine(1402)-N(4))-methyltransferase RsmH [Acidobacteriota bacterium]|nr:16S rRNA (cytosine(1402)-N(4))-methyltransferase RsmH [Acidobacteriota bacterium]